MMCLQRIEVVTRLDRVRNEDIRETLGQVAVVDIMKERHKRRWKEKLEGLDCGRLVKQVYEGNVRSWENGAKRMTKKEMG